ncbi:hypothetical protein BD769DRAFT_1661686 [Suillus cothurnatus]|nr:hypothetical protein BD769DRAFT_1661686 [Suillus cothurnatus]
MGSKRRLGLLLTFEEHLGGPSSANETGDQSKKTIMTHSIQMPRQASRLLGHSTHSQHCQPTGQSSQDSGRTSPNSCFRLFCSPVKLMGPSIRKLADHLFEELFDGPKYVNQRGAAYSLAVIIKGCITFIYPILLTMFGDMTADIHEATQDAPKAIMGNMSGWHQAHSHFLIDGVLLALTTITTTAIIPHLTGTLTDTHGQVKAAANKSPCGSCKDDERSVSSPEDIIHALHQSLSSGAGAAWITGMRDGRQEESRSNCWQSLPLPLMYLVLVDPVPEAHATAAKALGALVECLREGHFPDIDSGLVRPIPQAFIDKLPHHSGLLIHPFYHLTAARPGPTTSQLQVAPALLHDVIEITTDEEILSQVSVIEIMTTDDKDASQMPVHAHRELAITPVVPSSDALYDEADHATDIAPASPFPGPAEFRFMAESGSKALPDKTDRVTGPLAVLKVHLRAVITRKIALAIIIFAVPFLVKDSHLLQLTNHLVFAVESGVKSFTSALVNEV